MKKFSIVIAMVLVVALAVPTFATSFSDVPSDHWAYDAINKLVAAGIITGYPDGTYKGQRNLSRYEIAVIVSRALDNIAQERAALADKVDASSTTLSAGEAQDVTAIVKALIKKNKPEAAQGLSDKQADDVANLVEALTFEFKAELKTIGANVDALQADVEDLQADVAALQAAPKDNVSFSGTVDTYFQIADYGDNPDVTADVWADGDALDLGTPTSSAADDDEDASDFPAEKSFYQEIGLNANASVNDVNFDLALNTIVNNFTEVNGIDYKNYGHILGDQGADDTTLGVDNALLTIAKGDYTVKAGDMNGFDASTYVSYFVDDEDMEGVDFTGPFAGFDLRAFVVGKDSDSTDDYYGVTAAKDLGIAKVTGKVYQANLASEKVTDFAVEAKSTIDALTVQGEAVYNKVKENDTSDTLFNVSANYALSDDLTVRGLYETAGDKFNSAGDVLADLEENNNYDKYNVGADFVLNENNTVKADYTVVANNAAGNPKDKKTVELGLDNTMGAFTNNASVSFTKNDSYDSNQDVTVFSVGTEYAMSDATTVSANLVNKSADVDDLDYNYLTAGLSHKLSDNINWDTDFQYINGDKNSVDAKGNALTTQLSVSF